MEFSCLSGRKRSKSAVLEIFKRDKGVNRMYNILVCDDDREIVEAIEIYLSQEGYRILKAYDGIEALNILEKEKINLLIIDVMMPRLDGIRATLKIREKNSIPIIILSAKSEDADKILGLNVGADDYVEGEDCRNILKCGKYVERLDLCIRLDYHTKDLEKEYRKLCNRIEKTGLDYHKESLERVGEIILREEDPKLHYREALGCLGGLFF